MNHPLLFIALAALIGYLIGSVNPAIIFSRLKGHNIRKAGSGNPGTTNVLRTMGKGPAVLVFIIDYFKGYASVLLCVYLSGIFCPDIRQYIAIFAGISAILGHNFPIYHGFKGGKGVATTGGVVLALDLKIGLILIAIEILIILVSKYVSLASVAAAISLPVITAVLHKGEMELLLATFAMTCLTLYKHRENIKRLLSNKESKINFRR